MTTQQLNLKIKKLDLYMDIDIVILFQSSRETSFKIQPASHNFSEQIDFKRQKAINVHATRIEHKIDCGSNRHENDVF